MSVHNRGAAGGGGGGGGDISPLPINSCTLFDLHLISLTSGNVGYSRVEELPLCEVLATLPLLRQPEALRLYAPTHVTPYVRCHMA